MHFRCVQDHLHFNFLLKLLVLRFRRIALDRNRTLEYSERLYYISLAFLKGCFCNLHSVKVAVLSKIFVETILGPRELAGINSGLRFAPYTPSSISTSTHGMKLQFVWEFDIALGKAIWCSLEATIEKSSLIYAVYQLLYKVLKAFVSLKNIFADVVDLAFIGQIKFSRNFDDTWNKNVNCRQIFRIILINNDLHCTKNEIFH